MSDEVIKRALEVAVEEAGRLRADRWLVEYRNHKERVAEVLFAFHVNMAENPKTPPYDVAVHRQLAAAIARAAGGGA